MRSHTDLPSIKKLAQEFLMMDIETTPCSPITVTHPFTDSAIVSFSGDEILLNLLGSHDDLLRWQEEMKKQINESSSAHQILMLLENPHRMFFLKHAEPYLSQKDFSQILSDVWTQTDTPHNNAYLDADELLKLFEKADPVYLMDQEEYERYQKFGETLTVYCGVIQENAGKAKVSWSLNPEMARWFGDLYWEDGTVYEAQIEKSHIYAFFNRINELEVIVDPKYLMDITEYQEPEIGFIQMM